MHSFLELVANLRNVVLKCCSFGITREYIGRIALNNKILGSLLESINTKFREMCREDACRFVDYKHIQRVC